MAQCDCQSCKTLKDDNCDVSVVSHSIHSNKVCLFMSWTLRFINTFTKPMQNVRYAIGILIEQWSLCRNVYPERLTYDK